MKAQLYLAFLLTCNAIAADRYVSLAGGHVSPFVNWENAATNIQAAIDAASAGETVFVTNGVYSSGGKVMVVGLTNRVALTKPITVRSLSGPSVTIIQGYWHPGTTNGSSSVRCAWLTNNATLSGFTLTGGATLSSGDAVTLRSGGGLWCESTLSTVTNCVIEGNACSFAGGGAQSGTLQNCGLFGNKALGGDGGAAAGAQLFNCLLTNNYAFHAGGGTFRVTAFNCAIQANVAGEGGGAFGGELNNCTLVENYAFAGLRGGGVDSSKITNCIVYANQPTNIYNLGTISYSCTVLIAPGTGNISVFPQLLDGFHLASTSPCRNAGTNVATGSDLDGEAWLNPPSMGCDEFWESGITGPLSVAATAAWPSVAAKGLLPLNGLVVGRASRVGWDYGDGSVLTNASLLNTTHAWTNAGDYTVTFTAFNADNPNGVSTNLLVHVLPLEAPTITSGGLSGTNFSLSFLGQPGVTYMVEQATNLVPPLTWQAVSTVSSTGSVMQIVDTRATNDMRFYRVKGP